MKNNCKLLSMLTAIVLVISMFLPGIAGAVGKDFSEGKTIEKAPKNINVSTDPNATYPGEEIGYDDGVMDMPRAFLGPDNGWAVKMSLPEGKETANVTDGVFMFGDIENGNEFEVEVWDASGEDGYPGEKIAGPIESKIDSIEEWTVVDLREHDISVDGDFYMVYKQPKEGRFSPFLGTDQSSTFAERSYQYGLGEWDTTPEIEGNYMIRARVDYEVEDPVITSPEENTLTNEEVVAVKGKASPTTSLTLERNGDAVDTVDIDDDGLFEMPVTLKEGDNELVAISSLDGEVFGETDPVAVELDTINPEISIESPEDGGFLNSQKVTITGTATDKNLESVEVNGEKADLKDTAYTKHLLLPEGENTIEVIATDKAGNQTEKTATVEIITDSPTLGNIKPTHNQHLWAGDKLHVSFESDVKNGDAKFEVSLQDGLTNNANATETKMKEVLPGVYEGTWPVPPNMNVDNATVVLSLTDKAGNTTRETANGKLHIYANDVNRIAGDLRYDTAVETSQAGWNQADTVVLARGDEYADALAGVPLAYKLDAPILLTPTDELWEATADEIDRLDADNVVILGGDNAVGSEVESSLIDNGLDVRRIEGDDRFDTAALISDEVAPDGSSEVAVVNGMDFPDALSVASSAAQEGMPILLVKSDWMSDETANTIDQLGAEKAQVVGGPEVVSDAIADELPGANRLSGHDRYDTNIDVLEHFGAANKHMYVATGTNYADALTGAVLAAKNDSGILLVHKKVPEATADYITDQGVEHLTTFGGEVAVNETVLDALDDLLK